MTAPIYRYIRKNRFNFETLELETLGQGGIGFRFEFLYELNTIRFSFARCGDDDAFNLAECRLLLDKRFTSLQSYDIKDYDKRISLVDNVVAFANLQLANNKSAGINLINLGKHIKTIRKNNKIEAAKGTVVINQISAVLKENYLKL